MEKISDAIRQITAVIATALAVPIESARIPISEFPIGAVPRNTNA